MINIVYAVLCCAAINYEDDSVDVQVCNHAIGCVDTWFNPRPTIYYIDVYSGPLHETQEPMRTAQPRRRRFVDSECPCTSAALLYSRAVLSHAARYNVW